MRMLVCLATISAILLASSATFSQEFFGEFSEGPAGSFVRSEPRPVFKLSNKFEFMDPNGLSWAVPKDVEVDGASIPEAFWSFIGGPFSGNYLKASVVHDYYCELKRRTAHDTHRNFYYGMRAEGVSNWQAKLMYWAVSAFGPRWTLERRIVQQRTCTADGICSITPTRTTQLVSAPAIDLEDPEALTVALSKFNAVARTLRTTNGEVLDVASYGNIDASLASVEDNAAQFRQAIEFGEYERNPEVLGVLAEPTVQPINEIKAWAGNELPIYTAAPTWGELEQSPDNGETVKPPAAREGFRLEPGGIGNLEQSLKFEKGSIRLPGTIQFD